MITWQGKSVCGVAWPRHAVVFIVVHSMLLGYQCHSLHVAALLVCSAADISVANPLAL